MGVTRALLEIFFKCSHDAFFKGKKILTLGKIYPFLADSDFDLCRSQGYSLSRSKSAFAETLFLDSLGAESLESLDVSSYQGADIIADLNHPLAVSLLSKYDVVFDAGTLEHLFDLKTSLTNIFSLLTVGGIYYSGVVCSGWVDHGFYQFSPTFFVDFARHNSDCLELVDLLVADVYGARFWSYLSLGPQQKKILFSSDLKLGVIGVLKKTNDRDLRFDVMQSKYLNVYASGKDVLGSERRDAMRRVGRLIVRLAKVPPRLISESSSFPLSLRLSIAGYLDRLSSMNS